MKIEKSCTELKLFIVTFTIICYRVSSSTRSNSAAAAACELGFIDRNKLYNYSLASPIPKYPHGGLSEDGFYKVAVGETALWFQLCNGMIFNHDPPRCFDCSDCGGLTRCGMECSALVAEIIEGYPVCTTLGRLPSTRIEIRDKKNPHSGVNVTMSNSGKKYNCSLTISVICDLKGVQGPHLLEKSGTCDYVTTLRHPSGCAKIIHVHGGGLGWFGSFLLIIICLLGGYLLVGSVYQYFLLGVRGIDAIPNLKFWASLPHRTQNLFLSLVQKFRGPSQVHRSSYSPVGF